MNKGTQPMIHGSGKNKIDSKTRTLHKYLVRTGFRIVPVRTRLSYGKCLRSFITTKDRCLKSKYRKNLTILLTGRFLEIAL